MDTTPIAPGTFLRSFLSTVHLGDSSTMPVLAELSYTSSNPYALTLTIRLYGHSVPWTFARTLLSHGLTTPTGDGDVHVWPDLDDDSQPVVAIELCSRQGQAQVEVSAQEAVDFITRTYALVADGDESRHLDVDATIAAIRRAETAKLVLRVGSCLTL